MPHTPDQPPDQPPDQLEARAPATVATVRAFAEGVDAMLRQLRAAAPGLGSPDPLVRAATIRHLALAVLDPHADALRLLASRLALTSRLLRATIAHEDGHEEDAK